MPRKQILSHSERQRQEMELWKSLSNRANGKVPQKHDSSIGLEIHGEKANQILAALEGAGKQDLADWFFVEMVRYIMDDGDLHKALGINLDKKTRTLVKQAKEDAEVVRLVNKAVEKYGYSRNSAFEALSITNRRKRMEVSGRLGEKLEEVSYADFDDPKMVINKSAKTIEKHYFRGIKTTLKNPIKVGGSGGT